VKLLVDNNLPPRLAEALNVIFAPDHEITALREKFGRSNLKDEEWIPSSAPREAGPSCRRI
jgi:predicted nuclease of predicted toxin-antitoxin system